MHISGDVLVLWAILGRNWEHNHESTIQMHWMHIHMLVNDLCAQNIGQYLLTFFSSSTAQLIRGYTFNLRTQGFMAGQLILAPLHYVIQRFGNFTVIWTTLSVGMNLIVLLFWLTLTYKEIFPSAFFPPMDIHLSGLHQLDHMNIFPINRSIYKKEKQNTSFVVSLKEALKWWSNTWCPTPRNTPPPPWNRGEGWRI